MKLPKGGGQQQLARARREMRPPLADERLIAIWKALDELDNRLAADMIAMLLLTGAKRSMQHHADPPRRRVLLRSWIR